MCFWFLLVLTYSPETTLCFFHDYLSVLCRHCNLAIKTIMTSCVHHLEFFASVWDSTLDSNQPATWVDCIPSVRRLSQSPPPPHCTDGMSWQPSHATKRFSSADSPFEIATALKSSSTDNDKRKQFNHLDKEMLISSSTRGETSPNASQHSIRIREILRCNLIMRQNWQLLCVSCTQCNCVLYSLSSWCVWF